MPYKKLMAVLFGGLLLAACDTYAPLSHNMTIFEWGNPKVYEELTNAQRQGSEFTRILADGYQELATSERGKADWRDSDRWSRKGNLAAQGAIVHPELPERWDLVTLNYFPDRVDGTTWKDLYAPREELMEVFYHCGTREKDPQTSAAAQLAYDAWVEELEEGWESAAISGSREVFEASLAKLKTYCRPMEFVIEFAFGSAELNATALGEIERVARVSAGHRNINLTGWADTVGNRSANLALSAKRVDSVRKALLAKGVPADIISVSAKGNASLPKATGPNVKEQANRVVRAVVMN
ncbi:MAG: OmpA family protein [Rhodospirillaceae bacterium]